MFRKTKCRYYPNCIDQEECFFVQEEETDSRENLYRQERYCPEGENCINQSCKYDESKHKNMKDILCRFQERCTKSECAYKHEAERSSFLGRCTKKCQAK